MIAQLTEEHDQLRRIADQLDIFLDGEHAPVDINFSRLRWTLMRQLTVHLARERGVFGTLPHNETSLDETLGATLQDHMTTWDMTAIQQRWPLYRQSTRSLLRRLRYRMQREEAYLFPRFGAAVPIGHYA